MTQVIDLLSTFSWLNGIIILIAGVSYLYAGSFDGAEINLRERRRISFLLGLSMLGNGPLLVATGWARGLVRYLVTTNDLTLGYALAGVQAITTVVMIVALVDGVLTWRRASARAELNRYG